jgi:hypothetical protein
VRARAAWLVLAGALLSSVGCAPHVVVETAASPNPFANKPFFILLPLDEKGLKIGDFAEKTYFMSLDANHRAVYPFDRKAMRDAFRNAVVSRALRLGVRVVPKNEPDGAMFVIKPTLKRLEPGSFGYGWVSVGSRTDMVLTISTPDGKELDRIAIDSETPADDLHPTSGVRWTADASELGTMTALYLKKRVYGGD